VSSSAVEAGAELVLPALPQWVVFSCGGHRLALPLEQVREILTPRPFTRLPGTGPAVCGLIGVRSRIVTAFDLAVILGLPPARATPDHRLLLVESGEKVPALVVEEVLAVAAAELAPRRKRGRSADHVKGSAAKGAAPPIDALFVLGTGEFEGAPFSALDVDLLLDRLLS
jgi:chemotaxis signal transduction protein